MAGIRRVITAIDGEGESRFVSDEEVQPVAPPALGGNEIWNIFGEEKIPDVPNEGDVLEDLPFFPEAPEGYRFVIFRYPPKAEVTVPVDLEAALAETERLTPGMSNAVTDSSGMHYTATVDLEYVVDGEFTLTLSSGESKVIKPGDCLVQCGAKHSWTNESDKPATMLLVFVGAHLHAERFKPE